MLHALPNAIKRSDRPLAVTGSLAAPPQHECSALAIASLTGGCEEMSVPTVVSVQLGQFPMKTRAFQLAPPDVAVLAMTRQGDCCPLPSVRRIPPLNSVCERAKKRTRVRPPQDVIKLADRLAYLLQPPLESLLEIESLRFPVRPFPYQLDGVAFLFSRYHAVLADEMGLGKTMQAITAIRLLMKLGHLRRVLLVCPKPLLPGWLRELAYWAPELPAVAIDGSPRSRQWQWQRRQPGVVLANYELLVRDEQIIAQDAGCFDLVVLDEAQRIKNRDSATNRAVRAVSRMRSWALTGTPVENSMSDLLGLFDFVAPCVLTDNMATGDMARAAADYVLRRKKADVNLQLPPRVYRDAQLELAPPQQATYQQAEERGVLRLNELGDEIKIEHVFQLILRLKQICNFDPVSGASSKFERLEAELEECVASGQKAIVFSQWVATLDRLGRQLSRFGPIAYHGRVPMKDREARLVSFRDDPQHHLLLMSYGAGSVGLNLQFANYVFLFDRWWNPAVEDQAIARAHRIGSTGRVIVTRFLSCDTIEERIHEVLEQKRELLAALFSQAQPPTDLRFSREDLYGLFDLGPDPARGRNAA